MSSEWDRVIRGADESCASCRRRFAAGDEMVTTLDLDHQGFVRQDLCSPCFGERQAEAFSYWRRRRPRTASSGPRRLDLAYLKEFFRRLDGQEGEPAARVAWIVALVLLRRRLLLEVGRERRPDGAEVLHLRFRHEEREYRVTDPRLDTQAAVTIEEDLARIFNIDHEVLPETGSGSGT